MLFSIDYSSLAKKDRKKLGKSNLAGKTEQALVDLQTTPYPPSPPPPEKKEFLKGDLSGCCSSRLSRGDRIVYKISGDEVFIFSMRGHYDNLKKRLK